MYVHPPLSQAFLEFEINGEPAGRINVELFGSEAPKTVNNFLGLCTGDFSPRLNYSGSRVHRLEPGYLIQAGDITHCDGTGGVSVYSEGLFEN